MSTKPTTTIRIDLDVKRRASEVFDEIGIGMSAAINTFLKAVVREGNMPFDMKLERPKLHSKSGNATLNHAFTVKKDDRITFYFVFCISQNRGISQTPHNLLSVFYPCKKASLPNSRPQTSGSCPTGQAELSDKDRRHPARILSGNKTVVIRDQK